MGRASTLAHHGGLWILTLALTLSAGFALLTPTRATGQERYRLTEKDTWQQEAPPDPASPEGKLQAARKALAEDRPKEALKLATAWLKAQPNHPLAVQAHLLKGDAKTARRSYYKALFDYEYVIRQYPASEEFNVALEREYRIAQLFASGVNRKFLGMPILPAEGEAEEIFIRIQERAPGSELGEEASLALADLYYKQDEMASAADAYDLFLVNYSHSRYRERAMLRLIQSNLNRFRGPEFDPTGLLNATATIKRYQQEFPAAAEKIDSEALLARIDQNEARKLAIQASWYDRRGESVSANLLRQRLVTEHPATPSAQAAVEKLRARGLTPGSAPGITPAPGSSIPVSAPGSAGGSPPTPAAPAEVSPTPTPSEPPAATDKDLSQPGMLPDATPPIATPPSAQEQGYTRP